MADLPAVVDDRQYRINYPVYWSTRLSLRVGFGLFYSWETLGREHIPAEGPLIIASNHASFMDPPILGAFLTRPICFMARKTLFAAPFFSWYIRRLGAFPLDREGDPRGALRAMGRRLDEGKAVVMFPEGTRTRDGRLQEFKRGLGMLSARHNAPVLPVYLGGSFAAWPRGKKLPSLAHLRIEAGEPVVPKNCAGDRALIKEEETRVQAEVESRLRTLESNYFAACG